MSILIEKISHNTGRDSTLIHGYPPSNVYNVTLTPNTNSISVQWNDPEDTIFGSNTLSTWSHTLLVRKQGSYPISPDDGDIVIDNYERNKYKDTAYEDIGLEVDITYYYRFFTYNTDRLCNNSGDMIYISTTKKSISNILAENDWETIIEVAKENKGQDYWNIGDEIELVLSGTYNMTITLQIWDFNHYSESNITFGCKNIYIQANMGSNNGYAYSYVDQLLKSSVLNSFPSIVKDAIVSVVITYNHENSADIYPMSSKIYIPSGSEVNDIFSDLNLGSRFPIFTDDNSRIKYLNGSAYSWWLRDAYMNNTGLFLSVGSSGQFYNSGVSNNYGVVFCFNI